MPSRAHDGGGSRWWVRVRVQVGVGMKCTSAGMRCSARHGCSNAVEDANRQQAQEPHPHTHTHTHPPHPPMGYTSTELPRNLVLGADTRSYAHRSFSPWPAPMGGWCDTCARAAREQRQRQGGMARHKEVQAPTQGPALSARLPS